jgi:hypothetical protein
MDSQTGLITPDMLEDLPEPVQRYLAYTGIVGRPPIRNVRLRYAGRFRTAADRGWMPMTAEQTYTISPPGFDWRARFKVAGLPLMRARDTYADGEGHMFARLAWIVPIFDVRGEKLTQGTMLRYLQEACWFPTAYLEPYVQWQAVDESSADVTFTDRGESVTARMFFSPGGRLTNFVAQRYREVKGAFSLDTWSAPIDDYGSFAGLNLPAGGRGVWNLPTGDLPYIELKIAMIEYNLRP